MLSCALVLRRTFDPAATMELVDRYQATGLSVVPVMLDRIMELPDEVLRRFSGRSLRFVTAAGSRMRPDVVIDFMNHFGDVIYNNYNATEVGAIALAGPADLRAAPDTAGRPMPGTEIRILDEQHRPLPGRRDRRYIRPHHNGIRGLHLRTDQRDPRRVHGHRRHRLPRCRGGCSWWVATTR